jgi:hypothetical protein
MEFRFKDILKHIIPGLLIGLSILLKISNGISQDYFYDIVSSDLKEYSEVVLFIILALCYFLGYINDGLSSLIEHGIYWLFGSPSLKLLSGTAGRITLPKHSEILNNIRVKLSLSDSECILSGKYWEKNKKARQLFKYANGLKTSNTNVEVQKRVEEFYLSYVFSRNIFFAFTFSILVLSRPFSQEVTPSLSVAVAIIFLSLFVRRRDKAYYYSREVFLASRYG